jgi:hypothetical protein
MPDLNALKLYEKRSFSGQLHTKSMFLGQNKYTCGLFGDNMGTINTSTQSGVIRMRFNVSTRVPTEVTTFCLTVGSMVFEVEVEVEVDAG